MILAFANIILYLNYKSVVAKGKVRNSDSLVQKHYQFVHLQYSCRIKAAEQDTSRGKKYGITT